MKLVFGLVAASVLFSSISVAEDSACMLEGTFTFGTVIHIKDCMQLQPGGDKSSLKESCEGLVRAGDGLGIKGGMKYVAACEKPTQGICEGIFGSKIDAYYYKRSADELQTMPSGCNMSGGQWKRG